MKVLSVFSLLFVFLLFVGVVHPNPVEEFDHYHLVQQWTESFCNTQQYQCHPYRPYYFTIHGLWPQNKNDGEVNCSAKLPPFDYSKINETALISDLEKFWPNAATVNYTNECFWRDEWKLHGECPTGTFEPETAQREYFNRTVALAKNVSLTEALFKSGIKPGNTYKVEEIKNAVVSATKLVPILECNVDVNGKLQLYQVRFCVDKDAKTFQNCTYTATCCFSYSQIAFPDPTVSTSPRDNNIALPNPTVSASPYDEL